MDAMNRPVLEPDRLRVTLEAAGCRCTRQRRAVYEYVAEAAPYHPTAEDVYRAVKGRVPRISLATVYKALEALEACNLVCRLPAAGSGSARFDANCEPHYHLRCMRSGRVDDLHTSYDPDLVSKLDPELARKLLDEGFQLTGYRLELVGFYQDEPNLLRDGR
jgi:Fe2+ or Zn2+ uptake regulation protein